MKAVEGNWATDGQGAYDPEVRQMVRRYVDKHPPTETHGKIHEVDPEAVARFKQLMAQTRPAFRPQSPAEKLAQKLKQKRPQERVEQPETPAEESDEMGSNKPSTTSDAKMLELYNRAVAGEMVKELLHETDYMRPASLSQRWAAMGLTPVREARNAAQAAVAVDKQPPLPSDGMIAEEIDAACTAVKEMGARRPYIIEKRPYTPPAIIEEWAMPDANSQQPATNGRAVQVADGFDRLISLGRLARELQAAGVQVALSGEINIKINFSGGE